MKIFGFEIKRATPPLPVAPGSNIIFAASDTGIQVTESSSLSFTAVYACVDRLSKAVASLPLHVYRRTGNGGRERATDHPLYNCLHLRPNPEMSAFAYKQFQQSCLLLTGNAYAEIVKDKSGRTTELWPIKPQYVNPVRNDLGALEYRIRIPNTAEIVLPSDKILHVAGLGTDGVQGKSPITLCREAVALGLAAEKYGSSFYQNGAQLSKVLTTPNKLSEEAHKRVQADFDRTYTGLSNSHKTAILEEGMDIKTISMPMADAQFIESRKFQIEEIARIFNVPLHLIQSQDKANSWGAGIEQQNLGFVTYSLIPWMVAWEQEYSYKLLNPVERLDMFVEFMANALLRGTTTERYTSYAIGRQWGWLSANDVRSMENMNPIEDGDRYMEPLNMQPVGLDAMPEATGTQEGQ